MTWPSKKEQVGKMQEPVLGQRFEEDQLIGVTRRLVYSRKPSTRG